MSGHVAPKSMYYAVFAALIVGTALTVGVAFVDLGALNNVVMLGIALHQGAAGHPLLHARPLEHAADWVVVASGFFWLLILFGLTMTDYLTPRMGRGDLAVDCQAGSNAQRLDQALNSAAVSAAPFAALDRHSPASPTRRTRSPRIVYTEGVGVAVPPSGSVFSLQRGISSSVMADLSKDLAALRIPQRASAAADAARRFSSGSLVAVLLAGGGCWFWSTRLQAAPVKVAPVTAAKRRQVRRRARC